MAAPGVGHLPEQLLQLVGLRRGALGVQHPVADHVLDRADQAHPCSGLLLQDALDEVGGGGLAAGACHADHGQLVGGVVEAVRADDRQGPAAVRHLDIGRAVLRRGLAHHAGRALLPRHGDILMSVRFRTGDGDEQVACLHRTGVVPHLADVRVQVGTAG